MSENQAPSEIEMRVNGPVVEILQHVEAWHKLAHEQLQTLIDNGNAGVTLDLGELKLELNEESAKGFRIALLIAKSQFATLPFNMSPTEQEVEDAELVEG